MANVILFFFMCVCVYLLGNLIQSKIEETLPAPLDLNAFGPISGLFSPCISVDCLFDLFF